MDSKCRSFNLTPLCFILSLVSGFGWVHLESTCPWNGVVCTFVRDCYGSLRLTPSTVFHFVTHFLFWMGSLGIDLSPCFILSLISRSGWVHLESTSPCNGAVCKFVCDCHVFVMDSKSRRFNLTPPCFILSLVSHSGFKERFNVCREVSFTLEERFQQQVALLTGNGIIQSSSKRCKEGVQSNFFEIAVGSPRAEARVPWSCHFRASNIAKSIK